MEIKDLILLMWRNIRYIVLGLILGLALGFSAARLQKPVYEATTKIFVSRTRQQGSTDMLSLSDEQLLAINLQLAKSQSVLNEVSQQLGSKVDADAIQVEAVPNTLIIQIKVQDTDPQRAATTANLLVQTLIQHNSDLLSARYTGFEDAITKQIDQVQVQIDELQARIKEVSDASLQEQLTQVNQQIEQLKTQIATLGRDIASYPTLPTPLERASLAEKQAQLNQLNALMTLYQQIQTNLTYIGKPGQGGESIENPSLAALQSTSALYQQINLTLINSRENVRLARVQNQQNAMQIVSAAPPKKPVRPMPALYILLGGLVGLALSATTILMLDHFDNSIKKFREVEDLLGLPILGSVFDDYSRDGPLTLRQPHSVEADSFRSLGASLEVLSVGRIVHTVMIVNAGPADAKTNIAANWAIIHAQQGKKVILVDGDLKHPHLHSLLGMENKKGLADLANDRLDVPGARLAVKDVEGMFLVPAGMVNKEATTWLGADKVARILSEMEAEANLVIVEGPAPETADAQILASKIDAVILIIRQGHTRVDAAQSALRRLNVIGANVIGVVMDLGPRRPKMNEQIANWFKGKKERKGQRD